MINFEEIRKSLIKLSKSELKKIIGHATIIAGNKSIVTNEPTSDMDPISEFSHLICLYLKRYVSVPTLLTISQQQKLVLASAEIKALCNELKLDRDERFTLCKRLIDGAVDMLKEDNLPLSFATVLNFKLVDPSSIYNFSYPGYDSDLLKKFVLHANTKQVHPRDQPLWDKNMSKGAKFEDQ